MNNKNKHYILISAAIVVLLMCFYSCEKIFEVDPQRLYDSIYDPSAVKYSTLDQSMVLYLDHSTCVIDANQNSLVFKALKGQLGLYADTLCLIKGQDFEYKPNTEKSATSTVVYNIINGISQDFNYADIGRAVDKICNGNSQAILITDCEYFDKNKKNQDGFPYLSGAFKDWLQKGYVVYIVTEPYLEKNKEKKRFYFFFTDDKMNAPISSNMLNELQHLLQNGTCQLFKLTNSDIYVQRQGKMFSNDLDISDVTQQGSFQYVELYDSWNTIREYVMKLNKYGDPLENDEGTGNAQPVPLVQNLFFNDGNNYFIDDVEIIATNITTQYLALDNPDITPTITDISEGFRIDKDALLNNQLNLFLTDKIFKFLDAEHGGNLIRLDFVVTKAGLQDYDPAMFMWKSLYNNDSAICVAKSIENVLYDANIVPMSKDRRVIHTLFIKTEAYK